MIQTQLYGSKSTAELYVFRFFDKREHADRLVNGTVYISTLGSCRKHEGDERGDSGEASHQFQAKTAGGHGSSSLVRREAAALGIYVDKTSAVRYAGATSENQISDGFLVCATTRCAREDMKKIGKYCVCISNPRRFFDLVGNALHAHFRIPVAGMFRPVIYRERLFVGVDELDLSLVPFIKPPDKYAKQNEFRFYWELHPRRGSIEPVELYVPEVADLCQHWEI